MNREFLEHYNRELKILYERSSDFAAEFPGVAERLGGLSEDTMDPGLVGVLEGSAFMAARVQLKLKSEFSEFTSALLDQILPNYLAPIPSAALVEASPAFDDPNLVEGIHFKSGSYIDAVYVEQERRVSCRYRLCSDLSLWPLHLETAEYCATPAPLQALGLEIANGTTSGVRLGIRRRTQALNLKKKSKNEEPAPVSEVLIDTLPINLVGSAGDTITLYEQLFSNCKRISFRYLDEFGDPKFIIADPKIIQQVGFDLNERLFDNDDRIFSGFEILREFFTFPNKFIGFKLTGLQKILSRVTAPAFDILIEFDTSISRLASVVKPEMFSLYSAPASNYFKMSCSRIPIRTREHEHHVLPDRSKPLDFEAHKIIDVFAHYPGSKEKIKVFPLYSLPTGNTPIDDALFYSVRRIPRRRTTEERRFGVQSNYTGTELFLSLHEPESLDDNDRVRELSVKCMASNRHLTDQLPIGEAGADFYLSNDTSIEMRCVAGPTSPRESLVHLEKKQRDSAPSGAILWNLINLLSLNHLGLLDRSDTDKAGGLRELLSIFSDLSDIVTERRIRGIESIDSRSIVRRIKQDNGFNAARGIEIRLKIDEKAFEGTGIFLLGAALDRFFAEYASMNSFTETVIESTQRGIIKRWPPRSGSGQLL